MAQEIIAAATGRRKTAVARVSLVSGEGKCTINRKSAEEYVTDEAKRKVIMDIITSESMGTILQCTSEYIASKRNTDSICSTN